MIIKARSIAHIKESLDYIIKSEKNHIFLASDGIDTSDVKSMLSDFTIYTNTRVKNGFVSVIISPNSLDTLNQDDYQKVLTETLKDLKLDNRQYIAVMHTNTSNPHIHVILNRIDYDNQTWKDNHIAWKCQDACLKVTKLLNLNDAYQNQDVGGKKTINNEFDQVRFELKKLVQAKVRKALFVSTSFENLKDNLLIEGVQVKVTKFNNGLYGTTLTYENDNFKASKINRILSVQVYENTYAPKEQLRQLFERNQLRLMGKVDDESIYQSLEGDKEGRENFIQDLIEQHLSSSKMAGLLDDVLDDNDGEIDYLNKRKKALKKKPIIGKSRGM